MLKSAAVFTLVHPVEIRPSFCPQRKVTVVTLQTHKSPWDRWGEVPVASKGTFSPLKSEETVEDVCLPVWQQLWLVTNKLMDHLVTFFCAREEEERSEWVEPVLVSHSSCYWKNKNKARRQLQIEPENIAWRRIITPNHQLVCCTLVEFCVFFFFFFF